MDYIVLEGVKPYDGRYPFDIDEQEFTTREWGWIKRHAGYMPLTIEDGFAGADPELFAVFAIIALRRAGKIEARDVPDVFDRLADAPFETTIRLENDTPVEQEEDAGPPETRRNGNRDSSGLVSPPNSGTSEPIPAVSGTPGSASSLSDPTTLGR